MADSTVESRSVSRLVENSEFVFTSKDMSKISEIMMSEAGIVLPESKASLVYSRLVKRLRHLKLFSFSEYCELVEGANGKAERQELIAALTTNVTRFFREPHHFEHLRTKVLPDLIHRAKAGQKIRMWSAACSFGPEPYSMALTLLQELPDAGQYDIRILATDIDPNVLATASEGVFDEAQLAPVPEALRRKWFKPLGDASKKWQAKHELQQFVSFRQLNLIGSWPMTGKFQVIFCRNVVIYFDNTTQEKIWSRFLPLMEKDSVLYIGHSERISGIADRSLKSDGITIYRNVTGKMSG